MKIRSEAKTASPSGIPHRWPRRPNRGAGGGAPVAEGAVPGMVGSSAPMRSLARLVRRCAPLRMPLLLRGESGTGKELVARALHHLGRHPDGPYVPINGATLRGDLAGSELFGHRRGAFTGAVDDRLGAFQRADGGTLFLDEVASLSMEIQAALLRVVEDGMVTPVGGDGAKPVQVRLVAATCEPLDERIRCGRFRADLYQRLSACEIDVPPLRRRLDDLGPLAAHLLATSELGPRRLTDDSLRELRAYRWPGNVRELRNVLVQAALFAETQVIGWGDVVRVLRARQGRTKPRLTPAEARELLDRTGGNISRAAREAGLPRTTFRDLARRSR